MRDMYEKKTSTKIIGFLCEKDGKRVITVQEKDGGERYFNLDDIVDSMMDTNVSITNEEFDII